MLCSQLHTLWLECVAYAFCQSSSYLGKQLVVDVVKVIPTQLHYDGIFRLCKNQQKCLVFSVASHLCLTQHHVMALSDCNSQLYVYRNASIKRSLLYLAGICFHIPCYIFRQLQISSSLNTLAHIKMGFFSVHYFGKLLIHVTGCKLPLQRFCQLPLTEDVPQHKFSQICEISLQNIVRVYYIDTTCHFLCYYFHTPVGYSTW